jgi:hypothetical protein
MYEMFPHHTNFLSFWLPDVVRPVHPAVSQKNPEPISYFQEQLHHQLFYDSSNSDARKINGYATIDKSQHDHHLHQQQTTALYPQQPVTLHHCTHAFKLSLLEKSSSRVRKYFNLSVFHQYKFCFTASVNLVKPIQRRQLYLRNPSLLRRHLLHLRYCLLQVHRYHRRLRILSLLSRYLSTCLYNLNCIIRCPFQTILDLRRVMKTTPKSSLATAAAGNRTVPKPNSAPTSPTPSIPHPPATLYAMTAATNHSHHDVDASDGSDFEDDDFQTVEATPRLIVRALPPMTMLMQQQSEEGGEKVTGWNLIGSGKFEKEQRQVFAHHSQQYLPRNLPLGESTEYVGIPASVVLPITVQIRTPPKTLNIGFKNARVLLAILKLFQSAYTDSYLGPLDTYPNESNIVHPKHIQFDELTLARFMVKPVIGPNRVYCTKVIIHTNHTLRDFKVNPNFRAYIGEELLVIDHNHLTTATPVNVGFLEQVIPRQDTLTLHHERISRYLATSTPPFQMTLQKLNGKDKKWANVIMIQGAKEDVQYLDRTMIKASTIGGFRYFPYSAYTCLIPTRKLTVLNDLGHFHSAYRSISLSGFKDFHDDICMYTDDDTIQDPYIHRLATTTVSVYLQHHIKSADDHNLFSYIYPPSSTGIREALCTCANYNDAKSFAEVVTGELARVMDKRTIKRVFAHPLQAMKLSRMDPWQPFRRAQTIVETITTSARKASIQHKKRIRLSDPEKISSDDITVATSVTSHTTIPILDSPISANIPGTNTIDVDTVEIDNTPYPGLAIQAAVATDAMSLLQLQMGSLQRSVQSMEEKFQQVKILESKLDDVAYAVVEISTDLKTEIATELVSQSKDNHDSLLQSLSQLMTAQTQQLQTKLETQNLANNATQAKFKDAMERKLDRSTKNLVKLVETKERGNTPVVKPKTRTRSLSRAARLTKEKADDSMDDDDDAIDWSLYNFPSTTPNRSEPLCDATAVTKSPPQL